MKAEYSLISESLQWLLKIKMKLLKIVTQSILYFIGVLFLIIAFTAFFTVFNPSSKTPNDYLYGFIFLIWGTLITPFTSNWISQNFRFKKRHKILFSILAFILLFSAEPNPRPILTIFLILSITSTFYFLNKEEEKVSCEKCSKRFSLFANVKKPRRSIFTCSDCDKETKLSLKEKKSRKEELKAKYQEAIDQATKDYNGEKLEKEKKYLREEYISGEKEIDEVIVTVKQVITEQSEEQNQNKQKKEELKRTSRQITSKIKNAEKSLESSEYGDKKILKSYIFDKKDAKSYGEFKDNYFKEFMHCKTWPDFIKIYVNLFKGNDRLLTHLAKLIMEKEKSDNYFFVLKQLTKLYDDELSKHSNNLIEDLKEIDSMTGLEFEEYLRKLFMALGYGVQKTKATRDGGVDIILKKGDRTTLIQAKKYKINGIVGVDAVRDVHSNASKYDASELIVLTTAMNFSLDARKDASEKNVDLWNRDKLKELLKKAKMIKNGQD